jgi:hypothetical protein
MDGSIGKTKQGVRGSKTRADTTISIAPDFRVSYLQSGIVDEPFRDQGVLQRIKGKTRQRRDGER